MVMPAKIAQEFSNMISDWMPAATMYRFIDKKRKKERKKHLQIVILLGEAL
jgi:hypothetical protein